MSHLGRPKGVQDEFSLKHITDKVEDIIGVETQFVSNSVLVKKLKKQCKT